MRGAIVNDARHGRNRLCRGSSWLKAPKMLSSRRWMSPHSSSGHVTEWNVPLCYGGRGCQMLAQWNRDRKICGNIQICGGFHVQHPCAVAAVFADGTVRAEAEDL